MCAFNAINFWPRRNLAVNGGERLWIERVNEPGIVGGTVVRPLPTGVVNHLLSIGIPPNILGLSEQSVYSYTILRVTTFLNSVVGVIRASMRALGRFLRASFDLEVKFLATPRTKKKEENENFALPSDENRVSHRFSPRLIPTLGKGISEIEDKCTSIASSWGTLGVSLWDKN